MKTTASVTVAPKKATRPERVGAEGERCIGRGYGGDAKDGVKQKADVCTNHLTSETPSGSRLESMSRPPSFRT